MWLHFQRATPAFKCLYSPTRNPQSAAQIVEALALRNIWSL